MRRSTRRDFLGGCGLLAAGVGRTVQAQAPEGQDWPQYRGRLRDGVWREGGVLQKFSGGQLPVKWRVPIGPGYGSPTVAAGRVYVTDFVREPSLREQVHCHDWATGRRLWSRGYETLYKGVIYPNGPRAAVTVADGRAYMLGAMGRLSCLDALTGRLLWERDCEKEYALRIPMFGVSADPIVEGDLVVVHVGGSDGACVIAFDRRTGKEAWRALPDDAGYAAPTPVTLGGRRTLVVWTGGRVAGLEAGTGRVLWEHLIRPPQTVDAIISPVLHGDRLFVSGWFTGAYLLRVRPAGPPELLWSKRGVNERNTEAFHALFTQPLFEGDHLYGIDTYGELRCVDAKSGERVWSNADVVPRARNAGAHFIRAGERTWIFNERGELIIARLSPAGYEEHSRTTLIKPTRGQLNERGGVVWSHPAFAYRHVFARNDEELLCADLSARG